MPLFNIYIVKGQNPNKFEYVVTTADFYTNEETKALFANCDVITDAWLNEYISDDKEPIEDVPCDVNFDNVFDTMDYLTVKRAYFGQYPEAQMYCNKADLNNNLQIDVMDYMYLKRAYFGQYTVEE